MTSTEHWVRTAADGNPSGSIRPVDVVDAGTDHTSSARRETRRADPGRAVAAQQLWLDYRGRPLSPNAVGTAFTVLARRFLRSAVGVELNVPVIPLHGPPHSFYSNHRAAGESPSTVSRMLGHTSEVFSQTRYGHLTDDAGDSPLPLYGMSA